LSGAYRLTPQLSLAGVEILSVEIRGLGLDQSYIEGADKTLPFPIFLFAAQPKQFFFHGLKKLEQRSHKCVELRGVICTVKIKDIFSVP
jgi:hypothetical protein